MTQQSPPSNSGMRPQPCTPEQCLHRNKLKGSTLNRWLSWLHLSPGKALLSSNSFSKTYLLHTTKPQTHSDFPRMWSWDSTTVRKQKNISKVKIYSNNFKDSHKHSKKATHSVQAVHKSHPYLNTYSLAARYSSQNWKKVSKLKYSPPYGYQVHVLYSCPSHTSWDTSSCLRYCYYTHLYILEWIGCTPDSTCHNYSNAEGTARRVRFTLSRNKETPIQHYIHALVLLKERPVNKLCFFRDGPICTNHRDNGCSKGRWH